MSFESMQEELCQSGRDAMKADGVKSLAEAWEKCPRVDWMWAMLKATGKRDSVPKRVWQDLAVYAAESVLPIFEARYPGNDSVRNCIAVTRAYVNGSATKEQLIQARSKAAADAATRAARAARADYSAAAYAAYAAAYAADAADAAAAYADAAATRAARAAYAYAYAAADDAAAADAAARAARAAYSADADDDADDAAAQTAKRRELADKLRELTGFNPLAATGKPGEGE
jgi:hypothetical protein